MKKILLALWLCLALAPLAAQDVDSLYHVYLQSGKNKLDAINELNRVLAELGSGKGKQYTTEDNIVEAESYMLANVALYYSRHDQYARSINFYEQSIKLSRDIHDQLRVCRRLQNLYSSYVMTGNFDKALACLEESLQIAYALNDEDLIGYNLLAMGDLFIRNKQHDVAEDYLRKSIEIEKKRGDSERIIAALEKLCDIYMHQDRLDRVKEIGVEIDGLEKEGLNPMSLFTVFLIQAHVNNASHHMGKALAYLDSCLAISEALQMDDYTLGALAVKSDIYKKTNQLQKANETLLLRKTLCENSGRSTVLQEIYRDLYDINKNVNPALAMSYLELYIVLNDSLNSEELETRLANFHIQYETQEKEFQIERQQVVISRQNVQRIAYVAGLALAFIIIILSLNIVRLQKKRNNDLADMNATKDKFFTIISHDLKNPAFAIHQALQGLIDNVDVLDEALLKQYYTELLKSSDAQIELLFNLLNWAQVETGRMPFRPAVFDLKTIVRAEIDLLQVPLTNKDIHLVCNLPDDAQVVYGDKNMIGTVVRNLLTNAVKFTHTGGEIDLNVTAQKDSYLISITDDGVGMSAEKIDNLFKIDKQASTTGTQGESGNGLGLIVCKELVEKNGGVISVESEEGNGTTFCFTVPVAHK
jgi:signal transduction histidine kinase